MGLKAARSASERCDPVSGETVRISKEELIDETGALAGEARGWLSSVGGAFISDRVTEAPLDDSALRAIASTPGQAISYQIGKTQILGFLARARRQLGARFDLRDFHDYLLRNGNVPIALLEREYLRRR